MRSLIRYFVHRPVVANVLMFGLIFSSLITWDQIGKEEMPEFAMNWLRASIRYPGASAEDVELFVTKPIEEKLKGITGLDETASTSSFGSSSFRVTFEPNTKNQQEKIQEVKDAVSSVVLPREVEEPVFGQFRSSEKAIIDVGIYLQTKEILSVADRIELQRYALAFKNRLLALKEISGVESSGYLRPELHIKVEPEKLRQYEISMNQVKEQIVQQHVRRPIGSMKDHGESEVTLISELDDVKSLNNVIVVSGFQGQRIRLSQIAKIEHNFEKTNSITKVQGREGIVFNIKKSSNIDILTAREALVSFIEKFKVNNPGAPFEFVLIDDESYDVSNRISLITTNGLLGFVLIIFILFLFLDFKSGIWVAMGIPFSLAVTLIVALVLGYTVNNMTLAAIIIVLGIVVDDAIIVAENISRKSALRNQSSPVDGTFEVVSPIIASILTTCAAFIPLYFFSGRFGLFVKYIPTIVFAMLAASLIESFLILPSHMVQRLPLERFYTKFSIFNRLGELRERFVHSLESFFCQALKTILPLRVYVLMLFAIVLVIAGFIYSKDMKYVMFPREESRDFAIKVVADESVTRYQMAEKVRQIEEIFLNDELNLVTSVRTTIGQSRRGGEVRENEATIRVEILPPSEREVSLNQLFKKWQAVTNEMNGFKEIRFLKSRFGSDSGSPIVIEIQENNDQNRRLLAEKLRKELESIPSLINVEIERPVTRREYRLQIKKEEVSRLGINYEQFSSTLRAYIEGDVLYTLNSGEEEVDVRFTSADDNKNDINKILSLTVSNKENYLVPMKNLVTMEQGKKPANIQRTDFKRTVTVYADLQPGTDKTPLELGEQIEQQIFPLVTKGFPSAALTFRGEIEDSRESQGDFVLSVIMVLLIIYVLLVFLFNSIWTPFLIGAIVPFGAVGVILAFWTHGMTQYGFFAVIGTLGMIGVVINDSIVLIDKLESSVEQELHSGKSLFEAVATISASRLRAVIVTTLTTVAGLFPTAYGLGGYDSMLAEMMLAMGWGLLLGMFITLLLVPCIYSVFIQIKLWRKEAH